MNISRMITLAQGETVLAVIRRYWLTYLPRATGAFLLLAAPLFFMVPLFRLGAAGKVLFAALFTAGIVYALRDIVEWNGNVFIITDQRVVDVDQRGFFRSTVSEAAYDRIQDVSFTVNGVWGMLFRFGTVVVQTGGAKVSLELRGVKEPKDVHHLIVRTLAAKTSLSGGRSGSRASDLLDAASGMNDAEARAFLVALQEAVSRKGIAAESEETPHASFRPIDGIDELMSGEDDRRG